MLLNQYEDEAHDKMKGTQAPVYTGNKAQEHLAYSATDI